MKAIVCKEPCICAIWDRGADPTFAYCRTVGEAPFFSGRAYTSNFFQILSARLVQERVIKESRLIRTPEQQQGGARVSPEGPCTQQLVTGQALKAQRRFRERTDGI